jgi:hypothetical protein
MGWTERKTGFTNSVPPGISNMGFRAGQREDLGSLSTITTVMPQVDGNDALMKTFAEKFRKVIWTPRPDLPEGPGITVYQPPSEISYKDLTPKTRRYWGVAPTYSLAEVAASRGVVLPAPTRVLTAAEVKVFKMMAAKRRIFTFPGTNVTIFNSVLDQMDSIFEVIPFASPGSIGGVNGMYSSSGGLLNLPIIDRGWLKVRDKYSDLATVKDAFGKGMAFRKIMTVSPCYIWPGCSIGGPWSTEYIWGDEIRAIAELGWDSGYWWMGRNTVYPADYPLDDWGSLTKVQFLAWLDSLPLEANPEPGHPTNGLIKKLPSASLGSGHPHALTKNAAGWYDYTDLLYYDFIGARMAYYTEDNIMVAACTPYWLTAAYNVSLYDPYYTVKEFSKWWAYKEWGETDRFNQYFFNMMPGIYGYNGYIPPIQS